MDRGSGIDSARRGWTAKDNQCGWLNLLVFFIDFVIGEGFERADIQLFKVHNRIINT